MNHEHFRKNYNSLTSAPPYQLQPHSSPAMVGVNETVPTCPSCDSMDRGTCTSPQMAMMRRLSREGPSDLGRNSKRVSQRVERRWPKHIEGCVGRDEDTAMVGEVLCALRFVSLRLYCTSGRYSGRIFTTATATPLATATTTYAENGHHSSSPSEVPHQCLVSLCTTTHHYSSLD